MWAIFSSARLRCSVENGLLSLRSEFGRGRLSPLPIDF